MTTAKAPAYVIPPGTVATEDYAAHAARRLAPEVWAYLEGGGADGLTQAANAQAWRDIALEPRLLRDLRGAHTQCSLFDLMLPHPILLAPVAAHGLVHPEAERATALGAGITGSLMVVSTQANLRLETIAAQAPGPLWFQLYLQPRREDSLQLVRRAEAAGYQALVVTVDAPVNGLRNREQRAGFSLPEGLSAVNLAGMALPEVRPQPARGATFLGLMDAAPRWEDILWLKAQTRLPVLLKGIISPADATLAIEVGADGLIVSNHGGRCLDTLPATARALPRVAVAVAGRIPVLCDGGIQRGTDVLKALALGATAVLVGRAQIHALSVGGAQGVAHLLSILRSELEVAMALTGCKTLADITPEVLFRD